MSSSLRHFSARLRRRITLVLAVAVLFAGLAQAAHFHRDELAGHESQADTHCLLCLFAAGTAGPPAPMVRVSGPVSRFGRPLLICVGAVFHSDPASYDARGPPTA